MLEGIELYVVGASALAAAWCAGCLRVLVFCDGGSEAPPIGGVRLRCSPSTSLP